jgi:hypothetical protein
VAVRGEAPGPGAVSRVYDCPGVALGTHKLTATRWTIRCEYCDLRVRFRPVRDGGLYLRAGLETTWLGRARACLVLMLQLGWRKFRRRP